MDQLHKMRNDVIHQSWHIIFYFYQEHLFNIKISSRENKWQMLLKTPFDPASVRLCRWFTVAVNNGVNCRPFSASKTQLCSSREKKKNFNSDIILTSSLNVVHHYYGLSKLKPTARGKSNSFELGAIGIYLKGHI